MRAGGNMGYTPAIGEPENVSKTDSVLSEAAQEKSTEKDVIWFWLGLGVLYLVWDYFVLKNKKLNEVIEPANIRANLYNIVFIGFAAVIFVNGAKVLLVKVAALNIPGVSKLCQRLIPLFQLA